MNKFSKLIASVLMALSVLLVSLPAQAWIVFPTNQTDIDLKAYYLNLLSPDGVSYIVAPSFYNETEHLAQAMVDYGGQTPSKYHIYSYQTQIGYSYYSSNMYKYKLMCPDGKSTQLKNHIALAKILFTPNIYLLRSDGTACGSTNPPPPVNQTDINTIKAMYGPEFTVTRLWSDQDIFSVRCTISPQCDYWNVNVGASYPTNGVVYYSNTQKIGLRKFSHDYTVQWAAIRTKATVTNQTAKDDIDLLTTKGVEGQPWSWVDYSSDPAYTFWFN